MKQPVNKTGVRLVIFAIPFVAAGDRIWSAPVRREAPACNTPDRQVGINVSIKASRPEGPTLREHHAGPSDLFNEVSTIRVSGWVRNSTCALIPPANAGGTDSSANGRGF